MRFPNLTPLWYNLPAWYARAMGVKYQIRSIHRRGGKDVNDFSMTVQDAIELGGNHYYLFPTRSLGVEAVIQEQFTIGNETKPFWKWTIPSGLSAIWKEKESCVYLPHNGARIIIDGTDDLSIVGRGGRSYTMSEFSLHKNNVTGYIWPIVRQSGGRFRANGTLRGKNNQLYDLLMLNANNPEWFVQWLKPEQTKCYCWVSDEYNINPELVPRIGQIGPNMAQIFNVQDDIDSGVISYAMARQEFLNEADGTVEGTYYSYEIRKMQEQKRLRNLDPFAEPVYTVWDLGGSTEQSDKTAITFFQMDVAGGPVRIVDFYANTGHKRGHYFDVLKSKGYTYAGHYVPHDAKRSSAWTGESMIDTARNTYGIEMRAIPKTNSVMADIEITRRDFVNYEIDETRCHELVTDLQNYHESTGTGKPCHKNNCSQCSGASHGADTVRQLAMARHLKLIEPYLQPVQRRRTPDFVRDDWFIA